MKRGAAQETDKPNKKGKWLEDIWIPEEIWETIFSHLPLSAFSNAAQVSKQWHGLIQKLSRQWLTSHVPYLATHEDFQNAPLNLVIKECVRYNTMLPAIPMTAILAALRGETESILSETDSTIKRMLLALLCINNHPLPPEIEEAEILEIKGLALEYAAESDNLAACSQLFAIPGLDENKGWALLSAAKGGYTHIVKLLLKKEHEIFGWQKGLALQSAAGKGHTDIVNVFLEQCSTVLEYDKHLSLQLAKDNGRDEVVAVIENHLNPQPPTVTFAYEQEQQKTSSESEEALNQDKQPKYSSGRF